MSRGRKRRRKAALRGAYIERWMELREKEQTEGKASLGGYFDDVMRDGRGTRRGFPPSVAQELMRLRLFSSAGRTHGQC